MLWNWCIIMFNTAFPTFYKRMQVKNFSFLKNHKGPVIIAMNHPNGFTDPIGFASKFSPAKSYFLARGDAFKEGFVSWILNTVGVIPIFRIQDGGKEGLMKNDDSYKVVNEFLKKNRKIMIFAEGLCIQERRLRPIKKGTARMVFGSLEAIGNDELLVIPVGCNYSDPAHFRSDVFFNVGAPIRVADYKHQHLENPNKTLLQFTKLLEEKMKELVVHLNDKSNDKLIDQLQPICKAQWLEENKLDRNKLEDHHQWWLHIADKLNRATVEQPGKVEELKGVCAEYSKKIKNLKIRDHLIRADLDNKSPLLFQRLILTMLGYPLYLVGKLTNYAPYKTSRFVADKIVKVIEFHSSFSIVLGVFIFQAYYLIELLFIWFIFYSWPALGIYTLIKILSGWFSLHFMMYKRKTFGAFRYFMLKKKQPELVEGLKEKRESVFEALRELHY